MPHYNSTLSFIFYQFLAIIFAGVKVNVVFHLFMWGCCKWKLFWTYSINRTEMEVIHPMPPIEFATPVCKIYPSQNEDCGFRSVRSLSTIYWSSLSKQRDPSAPTTKMAALECQIFQCHPVKLSLQKETEISPRHVLKLPFQTLRSLHVTYYSYHFRHWDLSVPSTKVDVQDSGLFPRHQPMLLV